MRAQGKSYNPAYELPPPKAAQAAGLRYVDDRVPGISRQGERRFQYSDAHGAQVRDPATLARIRALAVPPAWRDVWICPRADGHLQATGRDARGRKQYRYHRRWREVRDETKYGRVADFAAALPRIRRRVKRDLARPGLPREKVLAMLVRLLETTFMRVGNEEYARENESFGLTTLRGRQVRVRGARLRFRFRGKSGVRHDIELSDAALAKLLRRMQDLPGEELFQYVDEAGATCAVESADVNAYIREVAGEGFTSKDFRTWAGTVLAAAALRALPHESAADARRNLASAVQSVARRLGNTQAVCRKCYIHPYVIESYLDGSLQAALRGRSIETAVVALLRRGQRRERALARRSGAGSSSLEPVLRRSLARTARATPASRPSTSRAASSRAAMAG